MQSFIIVSSQLDKRQEYIQSFCEKQEIGKFDIRTFSPGENSFGIEEVRNLQKNAYLKAIQGKSKAIILENAQLLTIEAQNALLKILEEPPVHTFLFLASTTDAFFLPTILSRCKLITLSEKKGDFSQNDIVQYTSMLEILSSASVLGKLALAEKVAGNKEELAAWTVRMILFLREKMLGEPSNTLYPKLISALQDSQQRIQTTNVSPRIILEHTFLTIQQ